MKKLFTLYISAGLFTFTFLIGLVVSFSEYSLLRPTKGAVDLSSTESIFEDITASSGLPEMASGSIVFGDYDNDGWVDMIAGSRLFRNISSQNSIQFKEVTGAVGISQIKGNPLFTDLDNNGYPDIITTKGQIFLQKQRGQFVESSADLGFRVPENVHSLAVVDTNKDGWPDILAGMGEIKFPSPFDPPKLYRNLMGRKIVDASPMVFGGTPNYVRGIAPADFNNNGDIEVYFSNYRLKANNLFRLSSYLVTDLAPSLKIEGLYEPRKYFDNETKQHYGTQYGHSISSIWTDFNNDGNLDLWVSNLVHKFSGTINGKFDSRGYLCDDSKIYRNTGAPTYGFVDVRQKSGLAYKPIGGIGVYKGDELWAHTTPADFDNDGLVDVYVSQVYDLPYSHSFLFKNNGNFKFTDVSAQNGTRVFDSYAAAWADLNNDGKMDLVQSGRAKNKQPSQLRVLQNIMPEKNNYLKVRLKGSKSGTQAVTAQVRVFHKNGVFLRQMEGAVGTMNQQNDPTLHFGLGQVREILSVEVRWPSGKKQTIKNVRVNDLLEVVEPL